MPNACTNRVEERSDQVIDVLVDMTRAVDVLHQVNAIGLEGPVNARDTLSGCA